MFLSVLRPVRPFSAESACKKRHFTNRGAEWYFENKHAGSLKNQSTEGDDDDDDDDHDEDDAANQAPLP